ncbi:MAG: DNA polymerase III subunit beta [Firmicutes bacterium]|nr:DNA polymerase III subunit beta [Bacillota bacterium]
MRIVVQKNTLLQALQTVAKAVPSRTTKPVLYGIHIEATSESLILTGYNLEFGFEVTVTATDNQDVPMIQIEETGAIVLTARYLLDIVRKLPHTLVRIDTQELTATIRSGNATYTLNGLDPREYPATQEIADDRGFAISCATMRELVERTAFATSTSESRPVLTGVLWKYENGLLTLSATDSHRMATQGTEVETLRDYALIESIIPGKSLQELAKSLPTDDTLANIQIEEKQLLVSFANIRFFSQLIEGRYPDLSRIIPQAFKTSITIGIKSLQDCVERAALLARDTENQIIRLHLRRTEIEISSHSPEIGKIVESVEPNTFEGEDMVLACNAKFLLEGLRAIPGEDVLIQFTSPGSAFTLTPTATSTHIQLMQPVRQVYI